MAILFFGSGYVRAGTWTTLDYPGAGITYVDGISGNNIVGTYQVDGGGDSPHGFLYNMTTQSWTTLDYPGAVSTWVYGISGNNIVGTYTDEYNFSHVFLYNMTVQSWTTLAYPSDYPGEYSIFTCNISGNNIVGTYSGGSFLYDGTNWTTLTYPGADCTRAYGISGNSIVGYYQCSYPQGFLYNGTSWTTLTYPGAISTWATGIGGNNILGIYWADSEHGFLYDGTNWTTLDYPGASTVPSGISGNNIVGYYYYGDYRVHGFLYNPYSGGTGEPNNPYQIATNTDLLAMAADTADYDKCFILTADVDMGGQVFTTAIIAPDTVAGNYNGVGYIFDGPAFTGIFDGAGHKIINLTINTSGAGNSYLGLFGYVANDGEIKNLGIENFSITGGDSSYYLGGLVGNSNGSISNCYSTGSVSGYSGVGGLVGYNDSSGSISNCYSTGSVVASYSMNIGGLVGLSSSGISNCYSTGSVIVSSSSQVGGLVGTNSGYNISNCYSTSSVSGGSDSYHVGGLVGDNDGNISNCYSTGSVSGYLLIGGLVGANANYGSIVVSSFWDINTSGQTTSASGTGMTTEQMQTLSTFTSAGWDFTNETANGTSDYWRMCVDGVDYPRLNWQSLDGDLACPDGVNFVDFAYFAERWLESDCDPFSNNFCGGADMDSSGTVDMQDLAIFAENWLNGE